MIYDATLPQSMPDLYSEVSLAEGLRDEALVTVRVVLLRETDRPFFLIEKLP